MNRTDQPKGEPELSFGEIRKEYESRLRSLLAGRRWLDCYSEEDPSAFEHLDYFVGRLEVLLELITIEKPSSLFSSSAKEIYEFLVGKLFNDHADNDFHRETTKLKLICLDLSERIQLVKKYADFAQDKPGDFLTNELCDFRKVFPTDYAERIPVNPIETVVSPLSIGLILHSEDFRRIYPPEKCGSIAGSVPMTEHPELRQAVYIVNSELSRSDNRNIEAVCRHEELHCIYDHFVGPCFFRDDDIKDVSLSSVQSEVIARLTDESPYLEAGIESGFKSVIQYSETEEEEREGKEQLKWDGKGQQYIRSVETLVECSKTPFFRRSYLIALLLATKIDEFEKIYKLYKARVLLPTLEKIADSEESIFGELAGREYFIDWARLFKTLEGTEHAHRAMILSKLLRRTEGAADGYRVFIWSALRDFVCALDGEKNQHYDFLDPLIDAASSSMQNVDNSAPLYKNTFSELKAQKKENE